MTVPGRRAQLDEVAGREGPRHEQREAGKDVRERVLQREREGQARHGEHGHERGRGYAELVRYYERDEHPEQHPHAGEDEAAYGALELGALKGAADGLGEQLDDDEGDEQDDGRGQQVAERKAAYFGFQQLLHGELLCLYSEQLAYVRHGGASFPKS